MSSIPRFILFNKGANQYEVPVYREGGKRMELSLVVRAANSLQALQHALSWLVRYEEQYDRKHQPAHRVRFFPRVRYASANPDRRLLKRLAGGFAFVESNTHAAWLPVGTLSL